MARHAFLIAAHNNFYVLERLMRLLDDERNDIFLHVDRKVQDFDADRFKQLCQHSYVSIMPRRKVWWGDYSQVKSFLRLMRAALACGKYAYLHLLSDSDLPLKSNDELHRFFDENDGNEFVAFEEFSLMKHEWVAYWYPFNRLLRSPIPRVRVRYSGLRNRLIAMQRRLGIDRTRRFGVDVKTGSEWCSISTALAMHLVDSAPAIRRRLKGAFIPTEFYVQTAVWNSKFRTRVFDYDNPYRSNARLIDFTRGPGASPLTWRQEHLRELLDSDRIFARKFDPEVDRDVIERLVAHVQGANRER